MPGGWGRPVRAALLAGLAWLAGGCSGGTPEQGPPPAATPRHTELPATYPATTQPLHIAGLYITQATQRLEPDRAVPLVEGKDGYLRVFVLAQAWHGPGPTVQVRIQDRAGRELLAAEVPAPGPGVPKAIDEADPANAWNLRLPGALIQPGNTVLARVEAPPGVPAGNLTYPADGVPLSMTVVPVATLRITLIPVRSEGRVGNVDQPGRSLASWTATLRRHFPLNRIEVRKGDVFETDRALHTERDYLGLLTDLEELRLLGGDHDDQYFYGVCPVLRPGQQAGGIAYTNQVRGRTRRTALGLDLAGQRDGDNYPDILAHELGHTLGLRHAPCGTSQYPREVDPAFPYQGGGIGACGFDVDAGMPVDPRTYKDDMSYCSPRWCSDYDYRKILAFRAGEPDRPSHPAPAEDRDCLLVRGTYADGRIELQPAFQVHRPPLLPEPGPFMLSALDALGHALENVPFQFEPVAGQGSGADEGAFAFVLPMTRAEAGRLATLRLTLDGTVLAERHGAGQASTTALHATAGRDARGQVQLQWDARAFPEAIVRDARSGHVLTLGPGGHLHLAAPGRALDCLFSDGLHSLRRRVPIAGRVRSE